MESFAGESSGMNCQDTPRLAVLGPTKANPDWVPYPEPRTQPGPARLQRDRVKLTDSEELMLLFTNAVSGGHIHRTCQPIVHVPPIEMGPNPTKSVTSCFRSVYPVSLRLSSSFSYARSCANGTCKLSTITAFDHAKKTYRVSFRRHPLRKK